MRPRVLWHDRRSGSFSGSALQPAQRSGESLHRRLWNGSSDESEKSLDGLRELVSRRRYRSWLGICVAGAAIAAPRRSVATVENATPPPSRFDGTGGSAEAGQQYGGQRSWPLVPSEEQSP